MTTDIALCEIAFRTGFVTTGGNRILRVNDPGRTPAPRFVLCGTKDGNIAGVGANVEDTRAANLLAAARQESPFFADGAEPIHLQRYVELLSNGEPPKPSIGRSYLLPHRHALEHSAAVVSSESDEGARLTEELTRSGVPAGLKEMGFHDVREFWEPWCAVLHEGEPVCLAFAARLSAVGASVGVATAPSFRGRGYAAAATAGWTWIPSLSARTLFYGHDRSNAPSHRITQKLGLPYLGLSFVLQ